MKNSWRLAIALLLAVLFLAGCTTGTSGNPNPDPDPDPDPDPETSQLNEETAADFAPMAVEAPMYMLQLLQGLPELGFGFGGAAPAGFDPLSAFGRDGGFTPRQSDECVEETEGPDADGDGIPSTATSVFDCAESNPEFDFSMTISGTITVADKDDSDPNSGYTVVIDTLELTVTSGGETTALNYDLDLDVDISDTTYSATFNFDFSGTTPDGDFAMTFDLTQTYEPASATDPFAAGTLSFNGTISASAEGESYSLTVSSNPDLVIDDTCPMMVNSGGVDYTDSFGNTLHVDYSCDDAVATFEGTVLSPTTY